MAKTWLFTKQNQSVYVARTDERALVIAGPGASHQRHKFEDEQSLQRYQVSMAERMAEGGWTLYGVDAQRRQGERRANNRGTWDRRRSI